MHRDCINHSDILPLTKRLLNQKEYYKKIDNEVIKFYDEIIKAAIIDKEEYLTMMNNAELRMKGDQKKFYELLIKGPSKDILPELVNSAMNNLEV